MLLPILHFRQTGYVRRFIRLKEYLQIYRAPEEFAAYGTSSIFLPKASP
jgi:hypothetical protein